ncbi:GyrI-like domain-containing protein [Actinokineospora enzanensis]|uniref:GyrI-like domain-containing protein n=1 Tax=Actinokineospora enzanensis TaxID=155975 RepID=UPI000365C64D|nr:GyrI-like domain-containing protein [Actinokineospora enzanensis]
MTYAVAVAEAPARPTAVLTASTTWPEYPGVWPRLLDRVHAGIRWSGPGRKGRNVMLYLDDTPNVEVGVELDQPVEITADLVRSILPAGRVASTVHRGPYSGLGAAHEAVLRWCAEHGERPVGVRWEVYGHGDEESPTTEVHYLLG